MSEAKRHRIIRDRIAYCGECGHVSVDGMNFDSDEDDGWLVCGRCGASGPWAFIQEAQLEAVRAGVCPRCDDQFESVGAGWSCGTCGATLEPQIDAGRDRCPCGCEMPLSDERYAQAHGDNPPQEKS